MCVWAWDCVCLLATLMSLLPMSGGTVPEIWLEMVAAISCLHHSTCEPVGLHRKRPLKHWYALTTQKQVTFYKFHYFVFFFLQFLYWCFTLKAISLPFSYALKKQHFFITFIMEYQFNYCFWGIATYLKVPILSPMACTMSHPVHTPISGPIVAKKPFCKFFGGYFRVFNFLENHNCIYILSNEWFLYIMTLPWMYTKWNATRVEGFGLNWVMLCEENVPGFLSAALSGQIALIAADDQQLLNEHIWTEYRGDLRSFLVDR